MAEQHSAEGASTSGASTTVSDSTVELNVKTLDSQIYNFHVDKNMPVSSFKEEIVGQVGVPVEQQRLIFRGKVLKDEHLLSEYHVENGDTLHLVIRQPTQPQISPATGAANTSVNIGSQGNEGNAGVPRNRIGQISHSVVLGTLNVGDQGEGGVPDLSRVIGAVLNSLGFGNQTTPNVAFGGQNAAPTNASVSVPQGNDTEQGRGSNGGQSQAGNQAQFGQPFLSQPFQVPLTGGSIPPPLLNTPIPDSLHTLSEFMSRMEGVLSQNGYQPTPPSGTSDHLATELPLNARGLPTPEALSMILRHAQRLLGGPAMAALSHISGRMEQEAGSTDGSVRSQIQNESVQVGLAMQHLGALLLELGRTILMLRMGQSPAEAVVNAGPAVYISPSGPNPIMVQPFPYQTSPLFNSAAVSAQNSGTSVPVGIIGGAPRHINIHIHAGTSLAPIVSAVGARAAGGEGAQAERSGSIASGDSGATRVIPVRNVIAAAVPSLSGTIAVSPVPNTSQPVGGASISQPPDAAALSSVVSEVNSHIQNLLENMRRENGAPSGQQENHVSNSSAGSGGGSAETIDPSKDVHSESSGEASKSHQSSLLDIQAPGDKNGRQEKTHCGSSASNEESKGLVDPSPSCVVGELAENSERNLIDVQTSGDAADKPTGAGGVPLAENSERNLIDVQTSGDVADKPTGAGEVPLGLGGGLQPKRRSRQSNIQQSGESGDSSSVDQSQQARMNGQQIMQSLASLSTGGRTGTNDTGSRQTGQGFGQAVAGTRVGAQGSDGQFDVTGMMSQLLGSPALNGLLSGIAQQTGVGSPDVLRNTLQQFTQNPAMRNTLNQLAEQVDREDVRNMFAGVGTDQDGSLDFSSMFRQMMPIVSQVLGGGSVQNEQVQNMVPELLPQFDDRGLSGDDSLFGQSSQNDIQEVVERIALGSPSQDIFHAVVQNAAERSGTAEGELVDELCSNQDLADQFMELLRRDLHYRLEGYSASGGSK